MRCILAHFTKRQNWKLEMPWVVLCAESIYKQMLENVFCLKVSPSTVTGPPPLPSLEFPSSIKPKTISVIVVSIFKPESIFASCCL